MTLLYLDPRFLDHDTGQHPEHRNRLLHISRLLDGSGQSAACGRHAWQPVSPERLGRIHAPEYVDRVLATSSRGGGMLDPDTVVCPASPDVAMLAAGAACDAVDRILRDESLTALCLVRPPGHHALRERAMGFCLFNNIAIAARVAIDEYQLDHVLVVDWDVHHGNATQDAFYRDEQVAFFSAHRYPFYPGTGAADETGSGRGRGTTHNLPLPFDTPRERYLDRFASELESFATKIRPQLILISAGFDAHRADPVGSLGLEVEDFATLTQIVCDIANVHAEGRIVSVLEGGYNPSVLAQCVEVHLRVLLAGQ